MSIFKSKSTHAPNPESEKDVQIDLNSLDHITKWSDEQRKSLLFVATCLLPTAHTRALLDYRHKLKHDEHTSSSGSPLDVLTAAIDADSESSLSAALSWEKQYIAGLAQALKLTPNHSSACFPLLGRHADSTAFVEALPVKTLTERVTLMLVLLHDSLMICGGYDSRVRSMLRLLSGKLKVRWEFFCSMENRYASALEAEINKHKAKNEESDKSKAFRWLKIGSAAVVGGVLIGLTGGLLAAPLLGAGLAGIGLTSAGASIGALVASTSGIVLISTVFGTVGAGLTGYKMNRRVGVLEEFQFVPLLSKQAKAATKTKGSKSKDSKKHDRGLAVVVGVNGFLRNDQSGYETVWNGLISSPGLAQSSEIDILHWESDYLIELGASLHSVSASALVKSWTVGQIKKLMIGSLLAAISWPLQIVKVSNVIDASYSVVLERSEKAAIELANVIESRQAGHRPITLIGFSTGARMIFLALEELARRRDERLKAAAQKLQNATAATNVDESAARDISLASIDSKLQETDEKSAPTRASIIDENGEQKILTAKGYESLPKDSILLNADPVFDVFLFGTPIQCNFDRWLRVRSMVAGRLVNGYSNNDWLLTFVHSVNSASLNTAGLRPVTRVVSDAVEQAEKVETSRPKHDATPEETDEQEKVHAAVVSLDSTKLVESGDIDGVGIENVNLSDLIDGHIEYPQKVMDALKLSKFQP